VRSPLVGRIGNRAFAIEANEKEITGISVEVGKPSTSTDIGQMQIYGRNFIGFRRAGDGIEFFAELNPIIIKDAYAGMDGTLSKIVLNAKGEVISSDLSILPVPNSVARAQLIALSRQSPSPAVVNMAKGALRSPESALGAIAFIMGAVP
jgi:hypothetical protein